MMPLSKTVLIFFNPGYKNYVEINQLTFNEECSGNILNICYLLLAKQYMYGESSTYSLFYVLEINIQILCRLSELISLYSY